MRLNAPASSPVTGSRGALEVVEVRHDDKLVTLVVKPG
jgi:hypothetical protein